MAAAPRTALDVADDRRLVRALREGDDAAFATLLDLHSSWMLRLAQQLVGSRAIAEEVVQDAWVSLIRSLDRFEERSSLRTWLYTVLLNAARKRARREARSMPVADLAAEELAEPNPDLERVFDDAHARWPGCWTTSVAAWDSLPEERLLSREARQTVEDALERLPELQRQVFLLRDVEGWSGEDVCNALGIAGSNQRVLLHRARARIRRALERYFEAAA
jgi:RNA polymerase sigma-70 factor (ECF subfamily)